MAEDTLPPLWEKRGGGSFFTLFVHAAARGTVCALTLKIVNTLMKEKRTRRYIFDVDIK